MMNWLMTAVMHGGMALKRHLEGGPRPAAPDLSDLQWFAVRPANLPAFLDDTPRSGNPCDLIDELRARGFHALADDVEESFLAFRRRHPGCVVVGVMR